MGYYTVWVVGRYPLEIVEQYDESNDIPGSYPGLTFDYIVEIEEPGPAHYFASVLDDSHPFAIVTVNGQIVCNPHPGSEPDSTVTVGIGEIRAYLEANPEETITPMQWHS